MSLGEDEESMNRADPDMRYQAFLDRALAAQAVLEAERPGLQIETSYAADRAEDLRNAARLYCGVVSEIGPRRAPGGRFPDVAAMEEALRDLAAPRFEGPSLSLPWLLARDGDGSPRYASDAAFALQRVAGPNPTAIRRVVADGRPGQSRAALAERLDLKEELLERSLLAQQAPFEGGLARALDEGRLFVVDHSDYPTVAPEGEGAWLLPAIGLFLSHPERGLLPVGIQLGDRDQPCILPRRDAAGQALWRRARLAFQTVDLIDHQLHHHLAWTHLILREIDGVTARSLPAEHTLAWLLAPHLESVTINVLIGEQILLARDGMVQNVLSPSLEASARIWEEALAAWSVRQLDPEADVRARGCEDGEVLPFYPYRDQGLPVWRGVRAYVAACLAQGSPRGEPWAQDDETQHWGAALRSALGTRRAEGLETTTPEGLTDLVAGLIFLSSAHHSALSYAQADHSILVSNMPGSLHDHPLKTPRDQDLLPDLDRFAAHVEAMWLLSCRRFRRLTSLPFDPARPADLPWLSTRAGLNGERRRFNQEMARLDERLRGALEGQPMPYDYLLPSRISVAANI